MTTHNFELVREQTVPEINTRARLYRHVKTGAQLLSLINDDENKCFGINFLTPVDDSTGVAHILEHSVLCGSRKYPLKDPFIELAKGSMNTFLNAFTYADKTCYPVASQNLQDFYNLVEVYLDTVFHPLLTPQTFQEQGWHYEIESPDGEMIYKGVVFNEMKGSYASPDRALYKRIQTSLFPDTIYRADSGGDPARIPDLTYEQLKAFHATYYHPSNSLIFMYGDDDPEERLRLLDVYLSEFEPIQVKADIPLQPGFEAPRRETYGYAAGQESEPQDNRAMVSVNWMLPGPTDHHLTLGLAILEHILIGTPAAPLRKALIDSGLGEDITGGGLQEDLQQMVFGVGLKGIAEESAGRVEELILQTLGDLARDGIDADAIEASLNTVEFVLRENNTGSFPRGLSLMLRSLTSWLYGADPILGLGYEEPMQYVRARAREGKFFESLIQQYMIDNRHRSTVLLTPDKEMDARLAAAERERLARERAEMGEAGVKAAVAATRQLKLLQETPNPPEVLATLPALTLADLDRAIKTIPISIHEASPPILYHGLFTDGIAYIDLGMDLHALPQSLLPYVSLFGRALLEMGTEREDFVRLTRWIGQKTGGIRRNSLITSVRGTGRSAAWMFLRGKATPAQANDLLSIMREVLLTVRLDNRDRFRQMAQEEKARFETRVISSGSSLIAQRLRAHFSEADWLGEQLGGVSYLFFLRDLLNAIDADWPGVLAKLEAVRSLLVNRSTMLCNVTLDETNWSRLEPELKSFLSSLPIEASKPGEWLRDLPMHGEGLTIPGQINYVGKAADLYALGYTEHGSSLVILNTLNTSWLWEKVRKEGGAYGVGCGFDRISGTLCYTSYRDPNLLSTLANFDGSGRFLRELDLSDAELTRSIVGVIGDMDSYQLPDSKGYSSLLRYLTGTTDVLRQRIREEALSATRADFRQFADALERANEQGLVGVVGPQSAIEAANAERPGLFDLVKVL